MVVQMYLAPVSMSYLRKGVWILDCISDEHRAHNDIKIVHPDWQYESICVYCHDQIVQVRKLMRCHWRYVKMIAGVIDERDLINPSDYYQWELINNIMLLAKRD